MNIFKEKYEELMEQDVDKALEYCNESLGVTNNPDILVYIGEILMINEQFEDALEVITKAISLNCTNRMLAYSLKGESLFYMNRYKESKLDFEKVMKYEKNNFFASVYLIDISIAEKDYLLGIEKSNEILSSETLNKEDTAFIQTKKGWINFKYLEHQEDGYKLFKEALNNDKKCGNAHIGLGCYYLYKKNYINSIKHFNMALELGEECSIVYDGLEEAKLNS